MFTTKEKLETLIDKLRALPDERQELAVEALAEITDQDVYVLSDEERAVLEPALAEAKQGQNLVAAETLDVLNKPWA